MKVGTFNIKDYLGKLNEEQEAKEATGAVDKDGIIIPDTNKKSYDWLKSEYQKQQNEVTVTMTSSKFEPGYSFDGAKDFKPEVNMGDSKGTASTLKQDNLGGTEKIGDTSKPGGAPKAAGEKKEKPDFLKKKGKDAEEKDTKDKETEDEKDDESEELKKN